MIKEFQKLFLGESVGADTTQSIPNTLPPPKPILTTEISLLTRNQLLETLCGRFHNNKVRHPGMKWEPIAERLEGNPRVLSIVYRMEEDEGEPDVWLYDNNNGQYTIFDSSTEVPPGRRDLVYDESAQYYWHDAWTNRLKPQGNALDEAARRELVLLSVRDHELMNQRGSYDRGNYTLCWLASPADMVKYRQAYAHCHFGTNVFDTISHTADTGFRGKVSF